MKVYSFLLLFTFMGCASPDKAGLPSLQEMRQLRQCYLESDTYGKRKDAEVKLSVMIDPNGIVEDAKVLKSSVKDPNFSACMVTYLKAQMFSPRPSGAGQEIIETIKFHTRIP